MPETIVISAVNIRKGGTLTILRECLEYLSGSVHDGRIVAIVHDKALCEYPGIEYIEIPDTIKSWSKRLWCEYVTMWGISKRIATEDGREVGLWLSLHDTTPRVRARRRAVYCQTSFPFLKLKFRDVRMSPKIAMFAMFTRFAYRINVHKNDWLIVQAGWLREGLGRLLNVPASKIIVAPVQPSSSFSFTSGKDRTGTFNFLFPAIGDCHKNFETLCQASRLLERELGREVFEVSLTIDGSENKYTRWLKEKWGGISSIKWKGYQTKAELAKLYDNADCLVFPSRVETWGLPISEFKDSGRPMILSDLPYAHESSAGSSATVFFKHSDPVSLCREMKKILMGDLSSTQDIGQPNLSRPYAYGWKEIFGLIN